MTIHDAKTKETTFLDAKEQAPSAATKDMFEHVKNSAFDTSKLQFQSMSVKKYYKFFYQGPISRCIASFRIAIPPRLENIAFSILIK